MTARAKKAIALHIATHRRKPLWRFLAKAAISYTHAYESRNYNMATNGEWRVLNLLGPTSRVIFDVGANVGDWTRVACAVSNAEVHAFEVVPQVAHALRDNVGRLPGIHVHDFGLSDVAGSIVVHYIPDANLLSSAIRPVTDNAISVSGEVLRGDRFLRDAGVDRVDFMKIDAEGMDYAVLMGFGDRLSDGTVRAIQFEYGMFAVDTKFLLRDFHLLLEDAGYVVGKVFPSYVDFRQYSGPIQDEDFLGPNYIAVRSDDRVTIDLLREG